ncbi:hypothetical protein [Cellulomonas biazotea]|uniref:Uncharacterized protein n=1 Tax=Cellulomonas biazotea TaxID=1709 RepID=A0A402DLN1_9CELL|nr:hypothetical protein [Cellulomonas biazotea]GCE75026.1 hypothetical protein CBZ_00820 [Cellulomonas biazotea]
MRRRTVSMLVVPALALATAVAVAAPASAVECTTREVHGWVYDGDTTGGGLAGMTVELVGGWEWAGLGVVATGVSGPDGHFSLVAPCSDASATVRVSDPSGFYGTRYGYADTDPDDAPGVWLGNAVDLGVWSVRMTKPGRFVPVEPTRVIDTREDAEGPVGPGENAVFLLDELPDNTSAVVLNLTTTQGSAPTSFVSWQPYRFAGEPSTSVINSTAGRDVANLVTVPVSRFTESGKYELVLYNDAGWTHLVADIQGYYTSDPAGAGFEPVTPTRVLDTRASAPVGAHGTRRLDLAGPGTQAPVDAVAAAVTVTSTEATAATSYVSAYPSDAVDGPSTSVLNAYRGDDVPNLAVVPLGADGSITLYNDQGSTHLVVDVVGWYVASGGADFYPVVPRRADGSGLLGAGATTGFDGDAIPAVVRADATAMAVNLTTAGTAVPSYLTVHPTGGVRPFTSSANARPGADVATGVLTGLGPGFSVYNDRGDLQALVDVYGWFAVND